MFAPFFSNGPAQWAHQSQAGPSCDAMPGLAHRAEQRPPPPRAVRTASLSESATTASSAGRPSFRTRCEWPATRLRRATAHEPSRRSASRPASAGRRGPGRSRPLTEPRAEIRRAPRVVAARSAERLEQARSLRQDQHGGRRCGEGPRRRTPPPSQGSAPASPAAATRREARSRGPASGYRLPPATPTSLLCGWGTHR